MVFKFFTSCHTIYADVAESTFKGLGQTFMTGAETETTAQQLANQSSHIS